MQNNGNSIFKRVSLYNLVCMEK